MRRFEFCGCAANAVIGVMPADRLRFGPFDEFCCLRGALLAGADILQFREGDEGAVDFRVAKSSACDGVFYKICAGSFSFRASHAEVSSTKTSTTRTLPGAVFEQLL